MMKILKLAHRLPWPLHVIALHHFAGEARSPRLRSPALTPVWRKTLSDAVDLFVNQPKSIASARLTN